MIDEVEKLIASFDKKPVPKEVSNNPFDARRMSNPQGVIDDLLKQSTRQAKTIHEKNKKIDELTKQIEKLAKDIAKLTKKLESC